MGDPGKSSTREEQTRRLAESMKRQLGVFCGLLHESDVVEVMLNADGTVWVDRLGQPMRPVGTMPPATAESFIATVASTLRGTVTRENPILECELPLDGSRFEALIPPVVSAPVFTIRRRASAVFTLREYERQGIMTARQRSNRDGCRTAPKHSRRRRHRLGQDDARERHHRPHGAGLARAPPGHHRGYGRDPVCRQECGGDARDRHGRHAAPVEGDDAPAAGQNHRR
jgi:hypothetical protein